MNKNRLGIFYFFSVLILLGWGCRSSENIRQNQPKEDEKRAGVGEIKTESNTSTAIACEEQRTQVNWWAENLDTKEWKSYQVTEDMTFKFPLGLDASETLSDGRVVVGLNRTGVESGFQIIIDEKPRRCATECDGAENFSAVLPDRALAMDVGLYQEDENMEIQPIPVGNLSGYSVVARNYKNQAGSQLVLVATENALYEIRDERATTDNWDCPIAEGEIFSKFLSQFSFAKQTQ